MQLQTHTATNAHQIVGLCALQIPRERVNHGGAGKKVRYGLPRCCLGVETE